MILSDAMVASFIADIPPEWLAAMTVLIKGRLQGAAADYTLKAVASRAAQLRGFYDGRKAKEVAEETLQYVMAEAAAYPPTKAVRVVVPSRSLDLGFLPPNGDLAIELLFFNRADFEIHVSDVKVLGRAGAGPVDFEGGSGVEFVLPPRDEHLQRFDMALRPGVTRPALSRGGSGVDLNVAALISGPWEGLARATHGVFQGNAFVPVKHGADRVRSPRDVLLSIDTWFAAYPPAGTNGPLLIEFARVDDELRLPGGSAKSFLVQVAQKYGWRVDEGDEQAQLVRVGPGPAATRPTRLTRR